MDLKQDKFIKFYSCPQEICSCTDKNGDHTKISRSFRYFYEQTLPKKVQLSMPSQEGKIRGEGRKAIDVLKEMGIKRCCCRIKFLSLPLIPMIDRSKARFFDDVQKTVISEDTRELGFGVDPPDFPVL